MTRRANEKPGSLIPPSWAGLEGRALLKKVLRTRKLRVAVTTSFGAESAVLLDMVADINPATPVIFVDTGRLFAETLEYQRALTAHLDLLDVRIVRAPASLVANVDADGTLHHSDPDACCHARKVLPYAMAVSEFQILVTGRKRHHGEERTALEVVERAGPHIKVNPLAHFSAGDIEAAFQKRGLPRHPLATMGYASIGCQPCTNHACPGKSARAGRWAGKDKTECGIHTYHFDRHSSEERNHDYP